MSSHSKGASRYKSKDSATATKEIHKSNPTIRRGLLSFVKYTLQ